MADLDSKVPSNLHSINKARIVNSVGDVEYDEATGKRIFTGLMTREERDDRGNIFRVNGTKVRPDIKVLAQHKLEDESGQGKPVVIGKVLSTFTTTDNGKPALGCQFVFASTQLGFEYEYLYANGFMTDLSTGVAPLDGKPIIEDVDGSKQVTGYDITQSEIYEVSAVTIGINRSAKVFGAVLSGLKDEDRKLVMNSLESGDISKAVKLLKNASETTDTEGQVNMDAELMGKLSNQIGELVNKVGELTNVVSAQNVNDRLQAVEERLDEICSYMATDEDEDAMEQGKSKKDKGIQNQMIPADLVESLRGVLRDLKK